ncbi:hypothetical protein K1719_003432 [Acacia pycnantha]|nr:hypothetical protein K1719_003432 [Acacia pycnantha]
MINKPLPLFTPKFLSFPLHQPSTSLYSNTSTIFILSSQLSNRESFPQTTINSSSLPLTVSWEGKERKKRKSRRQGILKPARNAKYVDDIVIITQSGSRSRRKGKATYKEFPLESVVGQVLVAQLHCYDQVLPKLGKHFTWIYNLISSL